MATPATLAAGYRKHRGRAKERAAQRAISHEAKRQQLILAQARAKLAQEAADRLAAEARAKAAAERAEQEILEAERLAAAAVLAARERERETVLRAQQREQAEAERALRKQAAAEQKAMAARQADIEAHRAAERIRLQEYQVVAANDAFLREQDTRDAELTRAAFDAHLPPPPTSAQRLAADVESARSAIMASKQPIYTAPYELPSTAPNPPAHSSDRVRQVLVTLVAVLLPILSWPWVYFDPFDAAGNPLAPASSLLSPALEAQLIWPVLFLGFISFGVFQWLPSQHSAPRQRAVGYLAAAAMVLGGGWLWAAHSGFGLPAALFALAAAAVLHLALRRLNRLTARTAPERVFTDAPLTGFLGWMLVLAPASVAALVGGNDHIAQLLYVLIVVALVYLATTWAMSERGRVALALGFGWGMFWVVIARLLGANPSVWVALVAGAGVFVVLVAMENRRYQIQHAEHRAARGQTTTY